MVKTNFSVCVQFSIMHFILKVFLYDTNLKEPSFFTAAAISQLALWSIAASSVLALYTRGV